MIRTTPLSPSRTSLAALAAVALLAPAVGAQTIDGFAFGDDLGTLPFRRSLAAQINADGHPDFVVLYGGIATYVYGPTLYESITRVTPGTWPYVEDVAIGGGTSSGFDDVLTVSSQGLTRHAYNQGNFAAVTLATGAWTGATRLVTGDLGGGGPWDVFGVAADGVTVLRMRWNGSAYAALPSIAVPHTVRDLAVVDWDKAAPEERELVALTDAGLYAYDGGGNLVDFAAAAQPGGAIAPVRHGDLLADELLAWATYATPGQPLLFLLDGNGRQPAVPLQVPLDDVNETWVDLVALVAGDIDGDKDDDLLVQQTNVQRALVLVNRWSDDPQPSVYFDDDEYQIHDLTANPLTPATNETGIAAVGPLDGHEGAEVFHPLALEPPDKPQLVFQNTLSLELDGQGNGVPLSIDDARYEAVGSPGSLHLPFRITNPGSYDHFEIVLFVQNDRNSDLTGSAVGHWVTPLLTDGGTVVERQGVTISIPESGTDWPLTSHDRHYHLQVRLANVQPGTPPVVGSVSAAIALGMRIEDANDATWDDYLQSSNHQGWITIWEGNYAPQDPLPKGEIGGIVVHIRFPRSDQPPQPGPPIELPDDAWIWDEPQSS